MAKSSKDKGRFPNSFAGIPRVVMDNPDYINLSGNAIKLLNELARQYRGKNNGDLTVAYSLLKHRGFNSKGMIARKKDELLKAGIIIKTREGRFINPGGTCDLFALSWQSIDECDGKLEIKPTITPPRKFSLENNKTPSPQIGLGSSSKQGRQRPRNDKGRYSSSSKQGRLVVVT